MRVEDNNNCFACGKKNPIGLRLDIQTVEVEQTYLALAISR